MEKSRKAGVEIIRASAGDVRSWSPPRVANVNDPAGDPVPAVLTASQLDALRKAARDEGFEQGRKEGQSYGHREGLEEGRAEFRQRLGRLDALLAALNRPFEQLDEQVEREVVTLVIAMVRQLVRREVKLDPGQIVGVVREALGILPVSARNIRVTLHPDDAVLVREAYALGGHDLNWQILEDPVMQRGGCRVHTDTSQVDASLDSRLNSLIAPLLAGERQHDEASQDSGARGEGA